MLRPVPIDADVSEAWKKPGVIEKQQAKAAWLRDAAVKCLPSMIELHNTQATPHSPRELVKAAVDSALIIWDCVEEMLE